MCKTKVPQPAVTKDPQTGMYVFPGTLSREEIDGFAHGFTVYAVETGGGRTRYLTDDFCLAESAACFAALKAEGTPGWCGTHQSLCAAKPEVRDFSLERFLAGIAALADTWGARLVMAGRENFAP